MSRRRNITGVHVSYAQGTDLSSLSFTQTNPRGRWSATGVLGLGWG